eukprot:scaffold39592_cov42-Prasinocladus_malaysianus.AAC.1
MFGLMRLFCHCKCLYDCRLYGVQQVYILVCVTLDDILQLRSKMILSFWFAVTRSSHYGHAIGNSNGKRGYVYVAITMPLYVPFM